MSVELIPFDTLGECRTAEDRARFIIALEQSGFDERIQTLCIQIAKSKNGPFDPKQILDEANAQARVEYDESVRKAQTDYYGRNCGKLFGGPPGW